MEVGTDITELFKDTSTKEFEFEHNDKLWKFKYKELSWGEHWQVIEEAYDTRVNVVGDTERFFNANIYYSKIFKIAIVEIPGGHSLTDTYLNMLPSEVVTKMLPMVPGPVIDVEEAKKDLSSSPDGEKNS